MLNTFLNHFSNRFASRWLILLIDTIIVSSLYPLSNLLRVNFDLNLVDIESVALGTLIATTFYFISFLVFKPFQGIIRLTGLTDIYILMQSLFAASFSLIALDFIFTKLTPFVLFNISSSVVIIHFLLSAFLLSVVRLGIKSVFYKLSNSNFTQRIRVVIYGSGAAGQRTKETLARDNKKFYDVFAFVDDNPTKQGKFQDGTPILSSEKVFDEEFISKNRIHQVIIAINKITPSRKKEIIEKAIELGLKVKVVPPFKTWIQGELTSKQLKQVKIEDLLERDPIKLDNNNIRNQVEGKVIFVTGAAGSIGSEISRQLLHYSPSQVVFIDQAESALYDLEMEILRKNPSQHQISEFIIADITNEKRIRSIFETYNPDMIFHAAAYKHVPMMEEHPVEAVRVNVFGTKMLADLSIEFGVEKFVMISTDKAVNPTNVMGASKRAAEMYVQALSKEKSTTTQFVTTRFGNVLGSNGSVIPLFRKQIAEGGPLTITHPDITRYFMTIPEACNLVLEAGAMGKGGEVFVFDMGESVKILDLAKKMIHLSGLTLGKDIEIKFTGLRPGEKLYEELLTDQETTKPTHHPKILIADLQEVNPDEINSKLSELKISLDALNTYECVAGLKSIVNEFISNNSVFSELDMKITA